MNGSGLDALAALCGATGRASTENEVAASSPGGNGAQVVIGVPSFGTPAPQILPDTAPPRIPLNFNAQQMQQVMAFGNAANPFAAASMAAVMQAAVATQPTPGNPASINAMQQLAYYQYIQFAIQAAALQAQAQAAARGDLKEQQKKPPAQVPFDVTKSAAPLTFASAAPQLSHQPDVSNTCSKMANQQVTQPPVSQGTPATTPPRGTSGQPPPPQISLSQSSLSTSGLMLSNPASAPRPNAPAAAPGNTVLLKSPQTDIAQRPAADTNTSLGDPPFDDRKQLKRAANRRSAQLSRKRKKRFIEELREENDELRRKEQILMSIPDLIVVFDSSGKLWFVSHSVSRFLDFSPRELEGSSFWERLCDESVRLLKAAFMDALAARKSDTDTPPLGSGVWELRLVDKDGSHKVITLNGVVHFSGDSPECVCCIRPREERIVSAAALPTHGNVSISNPITQLIRPTIKPQQSVISNVSSDDASRIARVKARAVGRGAAQISDGDSGSICSESGSDDV